MPAEALAGTESLAAPGPSLSPAWRGALLRLGLVWAALILVFASDWAAMAGQWLNSSTYNHIVLIPPIIAWLVWLRLPQLVRLEPGAWWPGLIVFGGAMLLWVLGSFSGFNLARELGVVAMLGFQIAVMAITMTIIAIFAPVSFMGGIAGQYFKQFGLVVAAAVFFSLLVARFPRA